MTHAPRRAVALLAVAAATAPAAVAQDSHFGIRGLGTPGRWESVRARSTGGAFALFDAFSPVLAASLADLRRVGAGFTGSTSWRAVDAGVPGADASLRSTRFPVLVVAGPLSPRVIVGGGFATYLDRSFGVTRQDTVMLRGQPVGVTDQFTSDGAVADLRVALVLRVFQNMAVGAALHGLTGSTRVTAQRAFADSAYRTSIARDEVSYGGIGASVGAVLDATPALRVAAWARNDGKLRADIRGTTVDEADLPFSFGGGIRLRAGSDALLAGSVAWRYWAGAGPNAYDTFEWSAGAEVGFTTTPLRVGVRGGTLPFGPAGAAPTEFGIAAGIGRQFSGGRGRLDVGLERLERKGGGLTERTWSLLLGLTVRQ